MWFTIVQNEPSLMKSYWKINAVKDITPVWISQCNGFLKSIALFGGKLDCKKYPFDMVLCPFKEILIIFFHFLNFCEFSQV